MRKWTNAGTVVLAMLSSSVAAAPLPLEPEAETKAPTGLAQALAAAREHAPELRAAQARRGLVTAAKAGVRGPFTARPVLSAAVGPRFEEGAGGAGGNGVGVGADFEIGLAQPIEVGGQRAARQAMATRVSERVEAELAELEGAVLVAVARDYRAVALARSAEGLAAAREALATETLGLVTRRVKGGEAAAIERQVAEAELADATLARALASDVVADCARALVRRAGVALALPTPEALIEEPLPAWAELAATAPEPSRGTQGMVPAVRVARATASEARARAALATAERAPVPAFGVSLAREGPPLGEASWVVLGTFAVELPFTTPEPEVAATARAEAAIADATATLAAEQAAAELDAAYRMASAARTRIDEAARARAPLIARMAILERAFRSGELSLLDLTSARARLLAFDEARLTALTTYAEALSRLESALGAPLATRAPGTSAPTSEPTSIPTPTEEPRR